MKMRLFLTFGQKSLHAPILSTLTSRFGLVFSIFGAIVNEDVQFIALELDGDETRIREAIAFLETQGVKIEIRDK